MESRGLSHLSEDRDVIGLAYGTIAMDHVVSWRHMYAEVALLVMVWGLLAGGAASFTLLVLILTRD